MEEHDALPLEDRFAIQELVARYNFFVDTFQVEPLMKLWVPDDPFFDERKLGTGCHVGLAAIKRFFVVDVFEKMTGLSHLTGNFILTSVSDTGASGICTVFMEGDAKDGSSVRATGYYEDVYERTVDGWKFRSRTVTPNTKPQLGAIAGVVDGV